MTRLACRAPPITARVSRIDRVCIPSIGLDTDRLPGDPTRPRLDSSLPHPFVREFLYDSPSPSRWPFPCLWSFFPKSHDDVSPALLHTPCHARVVDPSLIPFPLHSLGITGWLVPFLFPRRSIPFFSRTEVYLPSRPLVFAVRPCRRNPVVQPCLGFSPLSAQHQGVCPSPLEGLQWTKTHACFPYLGFSLLAGPSLYPGIAGRPFPYTVVFPHVKACVLLVCLDLCRTRSLVVRRLSARSAHGRVAPLHLRPSREV